jgi:hypothetical protein
LMRLGEVGKVVLEVMMADGDGLGGFEKGGQFEGDLFARAGSHHASDIWGTRISENSIEIQIRTLEIYKRNRMKVYNVNDVFRHASRHVPCPPQFPHPIPSLKQSGKTSDESTRNNPHNHSVIHIHTIGRRINGDAGSRSRLFGGGGSRRRSGS